jgi:uncharacterized protein YndB with AHSA1/START domain
VVHATETVVIERELVIAARPETVWELLVDPAKAPAWMGMQSWSEPVQGGLYRVTTSSGWRRPPPAATPGRTRGSPAT